jgi:colanic acid/amylovoran biosynthesis glycosyltransferase
VGGQVKLLGWKNQTEVVQLLRDTHIFMAPSVTAEDGDQEGTPTVLMEALAQGLPVLSTRHSGIPEVVVEGESGYLVPERDVDALAERLENLLEHPEQWPAMGTAGRRHVEEHYDIDRLNDQLLSLYGKLSDSRSKSSLKEIARLS